MVAMKVVVRMFVAVSSVNTLLLSTGVNTTLLPTATAPLYLPEYPVVAIVVNAGGSGGGVGVELVDTAMLLRAMSPA